LPTGKAAVVVALQPSATRRAAAPTRIRCELHAFGRPFQRNRHTRGPPHCDHRQALQGKIAVNKPNLPWWSSMGFARSEPVPDTDYADMGTAFGLDASLTCERDGEPRPQGDAGPSTDRLNRRSVI
jgi:hypothetical protein